MNICKYCGTEMKKDVVTCPSCGEDGAVLYNYTGSVDKAADARKNMMSKWLKCEGRSRRNEFWKAGVLNTFYIFGLIILAIALAWIMWSPTMDGISKSKKVTDLDICSFVVLACFIPLILVFLVRSIVAQVTMTVRRLHDLGKKGSLLFVSAVPSVLYVVLVVVGLFVSESGAGVVGTITTVMGYLALVANVVMFVVLMMNSRPGINQYGTNPKEIYRKKKDEKKSWA